MGQDAAIDARRLQVSLRLKAARYLAGGLSKDGNRAVAITVDQLAEHPLLQANDIRKNRLEEFEQMDTDARPMELEKIAEALGVPRPFLLAPLQEANDRDDAQLSAEEALEQLQHATDVMEQLLGRLGRDVGRRDLRFRAAKDPSRRVPEAAV